MLVSSLSVWPRLAYPSWISLWTTESHPLSSKTGFGPTLRYIGDIFPNNSWITFHSHIEKYISELLALHYRFNKAISVLPDTFLPQSWSRLELAWSSAWWRRPPPLPACWCRCHPSRSNGCPGCPPANRTGVFVFVFLFDILQVMCYWWHWLDFILYRYDLWHVINNTSWSTSSQERTGPQVTRGPARLEKRER